MREWQQDPYDRGALSTLGIGPTGGIAGAFSAWLDEQACEQQDRPVFWAPYSAAPEKNWMHVRSVEQLAVLTSTAARLDNNVCFTSSAPDMRGRRANAIGLIAGDPRRWAVVLNDGGHVIGDLRRRGWTHDRYDSFTALTAAELCWSWAVTGSWPDDLTLRAPSA